MPLLSWHISASQHSRAFSRQVMKDLWHFTTRNHLYDRTLRRLDHIKVKSPMMLRVLCSKNEFNFVCIALERQNYQDIDRAGIGLEFMAS